jgi:hypothetical protein
MLNNVKNDNTIFSEYSPIIQELGKKWKKDPKNPVNDININTVNNWNNFINKWVNDPDIPLLIRKKDFDRGTINIHSSGRKLVPVDNSPAQWVFACICDGILPPNDIIIALKNGLIPIAMVLPKLNHAIESYRGKLQKCPNTQTRGWYLGHKIPIGLNKKMLDCTLEELKEHFIKLMSPSNMFIVPNKTMKGLAELNDFIEQQ